MIPLQDILLWIGIPLLLFGYLGENRKHFLRIIGYIFLGIFWVGEAPYFISIMDYVNAGLCIAALPLFAYFGYNEFLSKKWDEDPEVMRFLSGSISIGMLIYFGIQRVPIISGTLIKVVADQTTMVLNTFGYDFTTSKIFYMGNPNLYRVNQEHIFVSIKGSSVNIILACTGLQTIAAAGSLLYCTRVELHRKAKVMLFVLPAIYVANIIRNVIVIYLTAEGIVSFSIAHNEIAKTASVLVLIILLLLVFEMIPEFHDNIMDIINLPKREPIHQKQQR